MNPPSTRTEPRYVFDPDSHALSVVANNVLITVNQEYLGVYLKTYNLITGYNTDRQYVSMAAMDLVPPLGLESLPDKRVRLSFYAKDCEQGDIVKFVYVLRSGWDVDNSMSTIERQNLVVGPDCKVLCVHKFGDEKHPSLVAASNDRMYRVRLDPELEHLDHPIDMYRSAFTDDRKLCAVICKGSDFVVVDDRLSKFFRRQGPDFTAPTISHLPKAALAMQIVHNRGKFYVAVDRQQLYVVNERACRFMKMPLPEGRVMGVGLVFNDYDDLILTDTEGCNPAPYRFPSRGIPSLQTMSCRKVVSMAPEATLFESRKVVSTDEFVRVLFMAKAPQAEDPLPTPARYSPLYRYAVEPGTL